MEISQGSTAQAVPPDNDVKEPYETVDLEKDGTYASLHREDSGPPHSIFSKPMKMWIVFLVCISALISPFGATTYYPVLNVLSAKLHISPAMINISITTYMVCLTFTSTPL